MAAYFVTSTGTDIGKTFITAGLIRTLRGPNHPVDALKPVVSGYEPSVVETSDPAVLLAALGRPVSADEIDPHRALALPRAAVARSRRRARRAARSISTSSSPSAAGPSHNTGGTLFIEGVGGIMVPLDGGHTVLDWMAALKFRWCWWWAAISAPSATR